jgi:hypothetical protein
LTACSEFLALMVSFNRVYVSEAFCYTNESDSATDGGWDDCRAISDGDQTLEWVIDQIPAFVIGTEEDDGSFGNVHRS